MFKVHQVSWVHSLEKGVSFQRLGRYFWLYSNCRNRFLMLGTWEGRKDKDTGKYIIPIDFHRDAKYLPPFDDDLINPLERQEIKENIKEALLVLNADYQPRFIED